MEHTLRFGIGFDQIDIGSSIVAAAAPFWRGDILGGVLAAETDPMFARRPPG